MDFSVNVDGVRSLFEGALRAQVEEQDGSLCAILGRDSIRGPTVAEIESLLDTIQSFELDGDATIYTPKEMEILVREESGFLRISWARRTKWPLRLHDPDQGLQYVLGPPSDHFTLFLASRLAELARDVKFSWIRRPVPSSRKTIPEGAGTPEVEEDRPPYTLLDAVRDAMPMMRVHSLRIQSERDKRLQTLQQFAAAFSFHLAYNLDTAFVPVRSLEEVLRRSRLRRIRPSKPHELDPPRRNYESDLVYHYQLAVSTDSVPLEYLSYYHIAEHFFESVFEDDLIIGLKELLTQPSFSYRRKQDVRLLVKHVRDRLRIQHDDVTFSEQEALRLVFERYVDLQRVSEQLEAIQATLVSHYATNMVSFAKGDIVDLRAEDSGQSIAALSRRIYKTRNAVVHSKEGGKPRYQPFLHDRELAQELPLMRLVAEEIVVNSGTVPT